MSQHRPDELWRRRSVTHARSSPHLQGLTLEQLRDYRRRLIAEEDRISYWRRVTHARIDVLEAQSHSQGVLGFADLVRALGDTGTGRSRRALARFRPSGPLPELPLLADMWTEHVDPHDGDALADALERLRSAEQQLTAYRHALHERLDEATAELIVRYRRDPAIALTALPGS